MLLNGVNFVPLQPGDSGLVIWRVSGEGTTLWAVKGGGAGDDNLHAVVAVGRHGLAYNGAGYAVEVGGTKPETLLYRTNNAVDTSEGGFSLHGNFRLNQNGSYSNFETGQLSSRRIKLAW